MRKDEDGYIYFMDRIGDTFRWKGENVSTNEVGEALTGIDGIALANVYGVPIRGMDGKAGMGAITLNGDVDFDHLHEELSKRLPPYAVPVFLRVQSEAETTGTFKYRKVDLVREGFNPDEASDPVWFAHPDKRKYVLLTQELYNTVFNGGFKF